MMNNYAWYHRKNVQEIHALEIERIEKERKRTQDIVNFYHQNTLDIDKTFYINFLVTHISNSALLLCDEVACDTWIAHRDKNGLITKIVRTDSTEQAQMLFFQLNHQLLNYKIP